MGKRKRRIRSLAAAALAGFCLLAPGGGISGTAPGSLALPFRGAGAEAASPVPVKEIRTRDDNILLAAGSGWKIHWEILPENATEQGVRWTSGNPAVAEVDGEGRITGLRQGSCEIFGNAEDGSGRGLRIRVNVKEYETVISDPEGLRVDFDTTDSIRGSISYVGSRRVDDYLETQVAYGTGCAESLRNGWLMPVRPGEETLTVTVKKNGGKVLSREVRTVYVAQSAVETETGAGALRAGRDLSPRPCPELGWGLRLEAAEKALREQGTGVSGNRMKRQVCLKWEEMASALGGKTRPELYFKEAEDGAAQEEYRLYRVRCRFYKAENSYEQVRSSLIRAYGAPYHDSAGKGGLISETNWYLDGMRITLRDLSGRSFLTEWLRDFQ